MKRHSPVDIVRTIRGSYPRIPFGKIANEILGRGYSLSIVLCADALARRINRKYRNKKYSPNVLSFCLDKSEGEIFLNIRRAQRESRMLKISTAERITHLFVHGCLHLKGHKHSNQMDKEEEKILKRFGYNSSQL